MATSMDAPTACVHTPPAMHLLLADAEDRPALAETPESAVEGAPRPAPLTNRADTLAAGYRAPDDLPAQRWGVLHADSEAGRALLAALEPLRRHREAQQGAPVRTFAAPADLDVRGAHRWLRQHLLTDDLPEWERPRYLLLLGDLDALSEDLQLVLQHEAFVGRLPFADPAAVARYAERLVAREAALDPTPPRFLTATAPDGTGATAEAHLVLVERCLQFARQGAIATRAVQAIGGLTGAPIGEPLLRYAADPVPSMLFSVGHGEGPPPGGWASDRERRARQGALRLGGGTGLTGAELSGRTFLPGGIWFALACFGAGTPRESVYARWLADLGVTLPALPKPGEPPFIAALPRAALELAEGPVAVISHLDLAWTYGLKDAGGRQAQRFSEVFRALGDGAPVGVALDQLHRHFRQANDQLTADYERPGAVDSASRARLWMTRNDLRGYVLLGDPFARLRR